MAIGVPGYAVTRRSRMLKLLRPLGRLAGARPVLRPWIDGRLASTRTLVVHAFPADYYRFGEAAMREVLLEGLVRHGDVHGPRPAALHRLRHAGCPAAP